jgi:hypothetical protein
LDAEHAIYTHGQNEIQEPEAIGKKKKYLKQPATTTNKQAKKLKIDLNSTEIRDGTKNMR